jgi:squalene synthase HpnC
LSDERCAQCAAEAAEHRVQQPGAQSPWLGAGVTHYENFPVASRLLPSPLRPAVIALYRFARYADDLADEGQATPEERLAQLASLREALADPDTAHPMVAPLHPLLATHRMDAHLLLRLLQAFEQDVVVTRYRDQAMLQAYCERSANPIGRLMLQLFDRGDDASLGLSDSICTALQLINFLQDVAIDWGKGRVYLPLDRLQAFGIDEREIERAVSLGRSSPPLRAVIAEQAQHARALLESGKPLVRRVPLRLALELRLVIAAARRVLARLARTGHDPVAHRPVLGLRDMVPILVQMLR